MSWLISSLVPNLIPPPVHSDLDSEASTLEFWRAKQWSGALAGDDLSGTARGQGRRMVVRSGTFHPPSPSNARGGQIPTRTSQGESRLVYPPEVEQDPGRWRMIVDLVPTRESIWDRYPSSIEGMSVMGIERTRPATILRGSHSGGSQEAWESQH